VSDDAQSGPEAAAPGVDTFSLLAVGFFPTHAPRTTGSPPAPTMRSAIDRCCDATATSDAAVLLAQPPIEHEPADIRRSSHSAAGLPAIAKTLSVALPRLGIRDTMRVFAEVNQKDGFDCQSCAWPSPDG